VKKMLSLKTGRVFPIQFGSENAERDRICHAEIVHRTGTA
jgi:hypothetical protein